MSIAVRNALSCLPKSWRSRARKDHLGSAECHSISNINLILIHLFSMECGKRDLQEIDQQRFQTEEPTTLYMQYAVSVLSLTANLENSRRYKHYAVTDLSV